MKHTVKFCIYITVEAGDEDQACELAEAKLDEYALLPLDAGDCLRNLLEYEDTFQPEDA
jgi:hypothetical protein